MSWAFDALLLLSGGGGATSLTADEGSFVLTGETAGLTRGLRLSAAEGSFALTGEAAGLTRGLRLVAGEGAFVLTGEAAGLDAGGRLTAAHGVFSLTGEDAALTVEGDRILTASAGSFVLAGQAATLLAPTHAVSVSQAVQLAVHDVLVAALPGVAIYDYATPDAAMPFAVLVSQQIKPDDTFVKLGYRHVVKVEFWSGYRGQKEVLELLDTAWLALHNARLNLSLGHAIVCRCASQETALDNDGLTRRGDLVVNVRTMAA